MPPIQPPAQPPTRPPAPGQSTPQHATPSLGRRMACWLYEGLILFALMMVAVIVQTLIASIGLPQLNHPTALQLMTLSLCGAYLSFF